MNAFLFLIINCSLLKFFHPLLYMYSIILFVAIFCCYCCCFVVILVADCCFYNTFDKCMRELAYIILRKKTTIFINNKKSYFKVYFLCRRCIVFVAFLKGCGLNKL